MVNRPDKPSWTRLFSFRGRAGRGEYWRLLGLSVLAGVGISALALVPGGQVIGVPLSLAANVVQWAVIARRLHDLGRSGWWQVPATALGMAAAVNILSMGPEGIEKNTGMASAMLLSMTLYFAFLGVMGAVRGDPGANRWGEPPAGAPRP